MDRIALVHDYFTQLGGAERVAEHFYKMLPHADVFATVALEDTIPAGLAGVPITTSWMQRLPNLKRLHRLYFGLYPFGVSALDLSAYDVVISSSSGYAKGVRTRRDAIHVCYCHTPMRWVWRYKDYAEREQFGISKRLLLPLLLNGLKTWDENAARQPDQFVANSRAVAERIRKVYHREALIINPPIDVDRFPIRRQQDDYYLVLSRLVPYKRIDLAVEACNLLQRRLIIAGDGPDRARLEAMAGPTIEFKGRVSDREASVYAGECRALLFPGEEDFGMVPLEVAAAGRPTVAYRAGGALETIVEGVTGTFFSRPDARSLASAIEELEARSWSPSVLRHHASKFDVWHFQERFGNLLSLLGVKLPADLFSLPGTRALAKAAGA